MATEAATCVGTPALPPSPSKAGMLAVPASTRERWAPAELPETAIFSGSMPRRPAFARIQRRPALTSWIWAGHFDSPDSRYSEATQV